METIEQLVGDQVVLLKRLDAANEHDAIQDFVLAKLGYDCSHDDYDAVAVGCKVLYRDDYDSGESWYQVVDAQGHGDGTGEWHPVE